MGRKQILSATLCFLILGACTKEAPKKGVNKFEVIPKNLVSQSDEYLYSVAMQNASRTSPDVLPYSTGDNKRVKLEWTQTSLRVMEMEKDARFQHNKTNNKLVLEIPVNHVDYKCQTDHYGECTNTEIEDSDKNWDQKGSFKIKLAEAKSGGLDLLPILRSQTWGENCFDEVSSKVLTSEFTKDSVNLRIERTFKTKLKCFKDEMRLDDAAVSAVFHYSFVKVNSVISKGFQTIAYPKTDEKTFGFFSTEKISLAIDNNRTEAGTTSIMNRWNPERSEIVYYLSDEFNKPENAKIKLITRQTIDSLNQGLTQAGVKFRINLKDPAGKIPGDIRNSMIVLVEDPVASSVIGYGPQTEDPVTGEIVSARTVMFLGTIKKYIQATYSEILRAKKQDQQDALAPAVKETGDLIMENGRQTSSTKLKLSPVVEQMVAKIKMPEEIQQQRSNPNITASQHSLDFEKNETTPVNDDEDSTYLQTRMKYMLESKNCAYAPPTDIVGAGISAALKSKFAGENKPWEELSDEKKQAVIDILLPEIWVPTLLHEMGHNLGLRHNFQASQDKANYFSDTELAQLKIDHQIPFSSVMDYGNDLISPPVLGKYDIAALKFGYVRTVESKDGKVIPITSTLQQILDADDKLKLKAYGYCTDENVGLNPYCKRHDEGSLPSEITKNLIRDYKMSYFMRNYRNGKEYMSVLEDIDYARRIKGLFLDIRSFFESYEKLKNEFYPDDSPVWNTNARLKDIKQAAIIGGQFFVDVLLTPDAICVYTEDAEPTKYKRMFLNEETALRCSDIKWSKGFKGVGQIGKPIISRKDPRSDNSYIDQIDVRGIWIDKMLAVQTLFKRKTGNLIYDKYGDNYMDLPELRKTISNAIFSFQMNEVSGPVELTLDSGGTEIMDAPYEVLRTHMIPKPLYSKLAVKLGVPDRNMRLQEKIGEIVAKEMVNGEGRESSGSALAEAIKVTKVRPIDKVNLDGMMTIKLGADIFAASEDNFLAANTIRNLRMTRILRALPKEKLAEIIKAREAGATAPPATVEGATDPKIEGLIKAAWTMRLQDLQAFAADFMQRPEDLETILRYLPQ